MARLRRWFVASPDPETELDWDLALNASSFMERELS